MNRTEIFENLANITNNNILLSWGTGVGKSLGAIKLIGLKCNNCKTILIVIPKLVLINNWKQEIQKWDNTLSDKVVFSTYKSLPKHKDEYYDVIIFDEAHHLSNRCKRAFIKMKYQLMIALSATIGKSTLEWLKMHKNIHVVNIGLKDAIDSNILPDPTVYLLPLQLDNTVKKYEIKKFNKNILVTEYGYYVNLCNSIDYFEHVNEKVYLAKCNQRLKWLSSIKTEYIKTILQKFKYYRTLTFCGSIEQTEQLGKYAINSKNKKSQEFVKLFNDRKIKHITTVDILTEGMNLSDCRIGIFAHINGSQRLRLQKLGRILRHEKPVIIIPYYQHTREEEIVHKMLYNYNKDLIHRVININEIIL